MLMTREQYAAAVKYVAARDALAGVGDLRAAVKRHLDNHARAALLVSWFAGNAGWRSALQFFARPGFQRLPLAWRDSACPALLAARRPRVAPQARASRTARRAFLRRIGATGAHRGRPAYVCPVLSTRAEIARCLAAMVAHRAFAPRPVVVSTGIDTLELHTKAVISPRLAQLFERLFDEASSGGEPEPVELAGVEFVMAPRMVRGGWKLANTASDVVVRVQPAAEVDHPTVIVELHSACLWALGWREAADLARRLCEAVCPGADVDLQVTRIDLCADFQGWAPTAEDRVKFVSRAKKRGRFSESHIEPKWDDAEWVDTAAAQALKHMRALQKADSGEEKRRVLELLLRPPEERVTCAEYEAGAHAFTGFAFGMGHHLSARIYNKSRECRRSRKGWFAAIWSECPLYRAPPGGGINGKVREHYDVWRLEFQLRREALREFILDGEGGWVDLASWDVCAEQLDAVWQHLTKKWLRHGWRLAGQRDVVSVPWGALQRARLLEHDTARPGLARVIADCGVEPVIASTGGYASTAIAQLVELQGAEPGNFSALMSSVLQAAHEHAEKKGETLQVKVEKKREKIRARRAFLERRDRSKEHKRAVAASAATRYRTHEGIMTVWTDEDDRREERSAVWRAERARLEWEHTRETLAF